MNTEEAKKQIEDKKLAARIFNTSQASNIGHKGFKKTKENMFCVYYERIYYKVNIQTGEVVSANQSRYWQM